MSGVAAPTMSLPAPLVRTEISDRVGIITLDNGAKRNALSAALLDEVIAALEGFGTKDVRAVILRAALEMTVWSGRQS